jgi:DNA-3-methyladenine glycosylase
MRRNRGLAANAPLTQLARGPGRLSQALGLGLGHDGIGVLGGEIELRARHASDPVPTVEVGPRVGITKAVDLPYRFSLRGSRFVSPFRPGKRPGQPRTRTQR